MANIFRNFWLKVASLLVAVFLSLIVNYFFVNNESNNSILQFIVPVELKNVPSDKMIIWPLARQVEVTIQGPTMFLSKISNPIFRVAMPADTKNRFVANLKKEDLNLPPYVQVLSIKPPAIEFTLDDRVSRQVPVVVPKIGILPDDLKIDQINVAPDSVEISGPESEVKGVNSVETVPLDIRDINQAIKRDLDLRVPGTMSEIKPRQVAVSVEVSSVLAEERFGALPIELRSAGGANLVLSAAQANIKVSGPRGIIKNLKASDIIPYVRVEKIEQLTQKATVAVEVPERISIVSVEPSSVDVIKVQPTVVEDKKTKTADVSKKKAAAPAK